MKYDRSNIHLDSSLVLMILFIAAIPILVSRGSTVHHPDHEVAGNDYGGKWTSPTSGVTYNVSIGDVDEGAGMRRIIHLNPVGYESYVSITGHDYDSNGTWDRIFYCCYFQTTSGHTTGCNSVLRERTSAGVSWKWEPCSANAGDAVPFTDTEIAFAQSELDQAAFAIGNDTHLTQRYRWDDTEQACAQVFPPRVVKDLTILPVATK